MSLEELAGKAKELVGQVTGDKKTEVEGKVEATAADLKDKAENAVNEAKAVKEDVQEKAEATSTDLKKEAEEAIESVTNAAGEVMDIVKGAVDGVKNLLNKK